jgi:hypothetical protein
VCCDDRSCSDGPGVVAITLDSSGRPTVVIAECFDRETTLEITLYRDAGTDGREDDEVLWQIVPSESSSPVPRRMAIGETPAGFTEVKVLERPIEEIEGPLSLNVLFFGSASFDAEDLAPDTLVYGEGQVAETVADFESAVCG